MTMQRTTQCLGVLLCLLWCVPVMANTGDEDQRACEVLQNVVFQQAAKSIVDKRYLYVKEPKRALGLKQRRLPRQATWLPGGVEDARQPQPWAKLPDGRLVVHRPEVDVSKIVVYQPDPKTSWRVERELTLSKSILGTRSFLASNHQLVVVASQGQKHTLVLFEIKPGKATKLGAIWHWTGQLDHVFLRGEQLYWLGQAQLEVPRPLTRIAGVTLPPVVERDIVGRWPKLYNRRTHEERQRATKALMAHYKKTYTTKQTLKRWPELHRIDGDGVVTSVPHLGCKQLVVPQPGRPVTGLMTLSHIDLKTPRVVQTLGVVTSWFGAHGRKPRVRWTKEALYVAHDIDEVPRYLDKASHLEARPAKTRVLKFAPGPKSKKLIFKGSRDVNGTLWSNGAMATQGEDLHLWLMQKGKPAQLVTLTENPARARLEQVHALTPFKEKALIHDVLVQSNRLMVAHGLPHRLSLFDIKDPERPKKKAELPWSSKTLGLIAPDAQNMVHLFTQKDGRLAWTHWHFEDKKKPIIKTKGTIWPKQQPPRVLWSFGQQLNPLTMMVLNPIMASNQVQLGRMIWQGGAMLWQKKAVTLPKKCQKKKRAHPSCVHALKQLPWAFISPTVLDGP